MNANLAHPKGKRKGFLKSFVYARLNMGELMDQVRRARLALLISTRYNDSKAEISRAAGLSGGRITQLLDPNEAFGERAARGLETRLSLPQRWFDQEVENTEPAPTIREGVPLISWIQAGSWNEASDPFHPGEAEAWIPSIKPTSARAYALRVRGDSMTSVHGGRSYPEGCIIIVEPERRLPVNGERIVAKLEGSNEVTFKIYKEEDGRRWLQPINPNHMPIREPFKVLGTVVGKWEEE